ncbi:hypothetical protein APHAL10511_006478 [Amanita phalloides]|nr:hypothetical protein APHAL10511_006478 [Amanita phalloides]
MGRNGCLAILPFAASPPNLDLRMIPTPDLSHLTPNDYQVIYEPAEDTFLLLDALESDADELRALRPTTCLEIGSGSGCVSAFLGQILGPSVLYLSTDVNPHACRCTRATGRSNNVMIECINGSLANGLHHRLRHAVDIAVFNPPYVPTASEEAMMAQKSGDIEGAWAGGEAGMEITNGFLEIINDLLSPRGRFYLVALKANDVVGIRQNMLTKYDLKSDIILERRAARELLFIIRHQEERKKQDEIRRQINLLQAQLVDLPDEEPKSPTMTGSKRRQEIDGQGAVLAPSTPSPKKKRKIDVHTDSHSFRQVSKSLDFKSLSGTSRSSQPASTSKGLVLHTRTPAPSNMLNKLAALVDTKSSCRDGVLCDDEEPKDPSRSTSFRDAPTTAQHFMANAKRNDDLTIIEDIEPGPYEHKSPSDDPNFERLEPHSGIRLLSRSISHEDICEYVRGRFYLSPSKLYSCVRLSSDKQAYDVPVPGDWITIAVVAELGDVKYTRPPVTLGRDEDGTKKTGKKKSDKGSAKEQKGNQDNEENLEKAGGKRYINIKLVDFGARSAGSETGGTNVIRGDAFLSLLLFESDRFEWLDPGDNERQSKLKKRVKVYKGGSKGAFEAMHKIRQGDVIALLNPRVLKPFQRNSTTTSGVNATTNMLAVTPENSESIVLVGRARDLGRCNARKKDGQLCSSWCDTRVSEVCEWHMQRAVESRRARRAEFSVGTMGMSTSAAKRGRRREAEFDPEKQWGLLPSTSSAGTGSTYVLSGHVISSQSDTFIGERVGREAQARAQRQAAGREVEKTLKRLMEKDRDGMRSVLRAREVGGAGVKDGKKAKKDTTAEDDLTVKKDQGYSVDVIKGIGFNPATLSITGGRKNIDNCIVVEKLNVLAKLQAAKQERGIDLKARKGRRAKSDIGIPDPVIQNEELVDLDDL